jgi:hypothetical protein
MNTGDVISRGDPYQWQQQGVKGANGTRISRIRAAAYIDSVGAVNLPLFIFPSYSTAVKKDYPRIPVTIPSSTNGVVVSGSIRVPTSRLPDELFTWGKHISNGCQILSGATDFLSLCWSTASGASLASSVRLQASAGGVIAQNASMRFNQTAAVQNILGATNTADGVVSLRNVVAAGNALSANNVRLSVPGEEALIVVDLAVQFIDDAVLYEDVPGISRRDVFI